MNFYKCNKKGANVQSSKTITAGTTQKTVTPDTGYDAMGEVVVNPTPSTPITPSSSGTQFSAGLNDMSSSGWAYDSQQSGGAIHYKALVTPRPSSTSAFTLTNADYNLIKSGKAIIIAGMIFSEGSSGRLSLGFSSGSMAYNVIDSDNIGSNKTIWYTFGTTGTGSGFVYLVYVE